MPVRSNSARQWTTRAVAAAAATAAVAGVAMFQAGGANATATSTLFTITGVTPTHVAAGVKNQLITVTGTGFDEDLIDHLSISGCTTDPSYIVEDANTILMKTAGTDCAASADLLPASSAKITIADYKGATYVDTPATVAKDQLFFLAPPSILSADATHRPMVTENSQSVAYASQVTSGSTSGGTVVRVYAGSTAFFNSTAYPLAAWLDGVPMTNVSMHTGGDYFTAVLGAHAADDSPVLKIRSNGVLKSFQFGTGGASAVAGTHDFALGGNTISVSPAFGPLNGGNLLTVTGSGFTSATAVTVGAQTCAVQSTPAVTATKIVCKLPAWTSATAGPVTVQTSTTTNGVTLTSVVGSGSTYTFLDQ